MSVVGNDILENSSIGVHHHCRTDCHQFTTPCDWMIWLDASTCFPNHFLSCLPIQLPEMREQHRVIVNAVDKSHMPIELFVHGDENARMRQTHALIGIYIRFYYQFFQVV